MNKVLSFTKDTFAHWQNKNASRMGAAISFYALFSIAPLFILLIGIVRTIFDKQTTTIAITRTLNAAVGSNLASVIQTMINSAYRSHSGIVAAVVGGIVLIVAALSVFSELNSDLDQLWSVGQERTENVGQSVKNYLREKALVFLLIMMCGFLLLFFVAFTVFISFFHYELPLVLQNKTNLLILNSLFTLGGATIVFALIYRVLPNTKLPWRELLWGALVTAILFLIGRFLISWYISVFGGTSTYGTAGSIVGLLLWIYYSAEVFFIGASGTFIYSKKYGFLSKIRA